MMALSRDFLAATAIIALTAGASPCFAMANNQAAWPQTGTAQNPPAAAAQAQQDAIDEVVITSSGGGSGGNPALQPFRVNQFDLSIEWYPTRESLVSLAGFYKDVESFIYTRLVEEVLPGLDADPNDSDPETPYRINRTFNGEGATIKGFEFQIKQPLTFLPGPFDGLGINATCTFIDSESGITDLRTRADLPIEGLSRHSANPVGYYEKGPIGLRVGYSWRGRFLDKIGGSGDGVYYEPYETLSASVNIDITKELKLSLSGPNLLNSAVRKYSSFEEATQTFLENGRTFTANLRALLTGASDHNSSDGA